MDQSPNLQQVIIETSGVQFYRLVCNERTKFTEGTLKIIKPTEEEKYLININLFSQALVPGTPIVTIDRPTGTTILFPHIDQGLNGIFIPANDQLKSLLNFLQETVQLVPLEQALEIQQFKQTIDMHCADIQTNPLEESNQAINLIAKGGDAVKEALTWLGQTTATGICKGGQFIQSKINSGEEVQVSESTKAKLSNIKEKTNQAFSVAGGFLQSVFKPVAEKAASVTETLGSKIDQSDNKALQTTKKLTVATWGAAGNALTGLGQALSQVTTSVSQTTRQIVEKKYGPDVVKTYLGDEEQQQQQQQQNIEFQQLPQTEQSQQEPVDVSGRQDEKTPLNADTPQQ